jgi:hypothetical protein
VTCNIEWARKRRGWQGCSAFDEGKPYAGGGPWPSLAGHVQALHMKLLDLNSLQISYHLFWIACPVLATGNEDQAALQTIIAAKKFGFIA